MNHKLITGYSPFVNEFEQYRRAIFFENLLADVYISYL